jgi:hypothetical protein
MRLEGGQEGIESSFSEEKEAKRLLFVYRTRRCRGSGPMIKSFLVLFFKKEHSFLPSAPGNASRKFITPSRHDGILPKDILRSQRSAA